MAQTGGYVVGRAKYRSEAELLYAPGLGKDGGSNPYGCQRCVSRSFLAPKVVGESLKGGIFATAFSRSRGFKQTQVPFEKREDIVQEIILETPDNLKCFAPDYTGFLSPIDPFATPEPLGNARLFMSRNNGSRQFLVQGSSIELSSDGPLKSPTQFTCK